MSSFSSPECLCPPLFNGIAYRMKKYIKFFGAGQTNGRGQFSCFSLSKCDFYAFLCVQSKQKVQRKKDPHNFYVVGAVRQ